MLEKGATDVRGNYLGTYLKILFQTEAYMVMFYKQNTGISGQYIWCYI